MRGVKLGHYREYMLLKNPTSSGHASDSSDVLLDMCHVAGHV